MITYFFTFCLILVKKIEKHLPRPGFELTTFRSEGECYDILNKGPGDLSTVFVYLSIHIKHLNQYIIMDNVHLYYLGNVWCSFNLPTTMLMLHVCCSSVDCIHSPTQHSLFILLGLPIHYKGFSLVT